MLTTRTRHFLILAGSGIITLALLYLKNEQSGGQALPALFLPLILLAGYWENLPGALAMGVIAAVAIAGEYALGWMTREAVSIALLAFGSAFCVAVGFIQGYEYRLRSRAASLLPEEAKLIKVEQKARVIREQIEEYDRRLKNLSQLYEAAKKLMGILDMPSLIDEARTVVGRTLSHHYHAQAQDECQLAFYIPDDESGDFYRVQSNGHEISDEGFPRALGQDDLRHWTGETFGPLRIKDLRLDPRFKSVASMPFRSLVFVPLVMHEILIGVMLLGSDAVNAFSLSEFHQASVLGKQIVFALRRALLYRKVQMLSITDNLTGLYVHRHFQERFHEELKRAERYRHYISLILLDLDNFKRVNDQYGHPTGDTVLAEAAARIREAAGASALVARYGGEEFAVLLPNSPKARAMQTAALINEMLKATPIDVGAARLTITVSAGVGTYPDDALNAEALISAADAAVYTAKRNGRDLICGYTPDTSENKLNS